MGRVFAVDRIADLTNRDLDEVCGTVTVARGLAYAKHGHVVDLELSDDGRSAEGWVGGSSGQTYTTRVSLTPVATASPRAGHAGLRRWDSTCSCPVSGDCKHAVAVAATVRERQPALDRAAGRPDAPPPPTWERALGGLLDDPGVEPQHTPVGLLLEEAGSGRPGTRGSDPGRPTIRLRPVVPGVRGGWIRTGVSWEYLAAIHLTETRMGRIRGTSTAGAKGPMQFLPSTWEMYGAGGDINDPRDAIFAAARLLKANGAPRHMARALYHYNPSDHYVRAVSSYARSMRKVPWAYTGYWQWRVLYRHVKGVYALPVGYPRKKAVLIDPR